MLYASSISINPNSFSTNYAVNVEMWWHDLPFLERIQAAADAGFKQIEFWPWQGKDIDAIADVCKERDIEVAQFTAWGFVPGMNHPANHDAFVQQITESCAIAKRLRCKRMTVVGGNDQPNMTKEQMHQNLL